jgi:hypothetical protein
MKAGVVFTGTGPILILTSYGSFQDPKLVEKLATKGIRKFIAYELPIEKIRERYGNHFTTIMSDLKDVDDLRVLDYDGHHVFYNFSFAEMGNPVYHPAT